MTEKFPETISIEPLTGREFAPFGDVISAQESKKSFDINNGTTRRFHDLAQVTVSGPGARPIISLARAQPFSLPLSLTMMERHPHGSQAFIPLSPSHFLVIVAADDMGRPATPRAFMASPGQGINYHQNVWHGVLCALERETDFLIVDREGEGDNLEIFEFEQPIKVIE